MILEWSDNSELATEIMREIYAFISDDTCPPKEEFSVSLNDSIRFILCYNDGQLMGGFLLIFKDNESEIHTCMLPIAKGKAKDFGDLVLQKIFKETDVDRVTSYAPIDNPLAKRLALRCGMKFIGMGIPMIKNGQQIDVENFAIERADICQQYQL
ncbi:MAG TPA: GNAT family protein [Cellvibrio sp.]